MDSKVLETLLRLNEESQTNQDAGSENDLFNQAALATIINTLGSTPRKAGAQILFFRDGRVVGTIGGGCGEAEVRQHAFRVIEQGQPAVVEINLTHEAAAEDGMVCGGAMQVYIEPALYSPEKV
ncbi:XdhC family protein [Desulfitobacterium sp.]|uniref:XdhC family protein n=1 Tax=Desulfitobacterium sp. TaxID=49981 RepID=UPI002D180887|nr:XdhC family protein [Desulfitobacterium sp.]HVJ50250.1 XdhC family protein [Desulfitobacterium sp.]